MVKLKIEIAICTWNRASLLRQTLSRLQSLSIPPSVELKIIVVDNNSNDETEQTVVESSGPIEVGYFQEAQQGHTYARNRAIDIASGDALLWIDDDVNVSDHWLVSYVDAIDRDNEVAFWGGPIEPKFDHVCPKWVAENWFKLKGCFAERDLGPKRIAFSNDVLPYGANFAIRTQMQKQYRFSVNLGRTGNAVVGEDELDLYRRMLNDGEKGAWVPGASVQHIIDSSRTTAQYVADYFTGQGRVLVAKEAGWCKDPAELKKEAAHELFWYRMKRYFTPSDVWVSHLIRGSLAKGQWQALSEAAK